jgi:hypothetical protein
VGRQAATFDDEPDLGRRCGGHRGVRGHGHRHGPPRPWRTRAKAVVQVGVVQHESADGAVVEAGGYDRRVKIGIRHYPQGRGRWLAIAGALFAVALLAAPVRAAEPGGDHPNDMNCGTIFWLIPPEPERADPDYEFYREKMDRGCREARVTRVTTAAVVSVLTVFAMALLARRHAKPLPQSSGHDLPNR